MKYRSRKLRFTRHCPYLGISNEAFQTVFLCTIDDRQTIGIPRRRLLSVLLHIAWSITLFSWHSSSYLFVFCLRRRLPQCCQFHLVIVFYLSVFSRWNIVDSSSRASAIANVPKYWNLFACLLRQNNISFSILWPKRRREDLTRFTQYEHLNALFRLSSLRDNEKIFDFVTISLRDIRCKHPLNIIWHWIGFRETFQNVQIIVNKSSPADYT